MTMIRDGNIRAFDVQGRALFACAAVTRETLDLLAVASGACLDVRRLFGRHHGQAEGQFRRFIETISALESSWRRRYGKSSGRVVTELPKPPPAPKHDPDPAR